VIEPLQSSYRRLNIWGHLEQSKGSLESTNSSLNWFLASKPLIVFILFDGWLTILLAIQPFSNDFIAKITKSSLYLRIKGKFRNDSLVVLINFLQISRDSLTQGTIFSHRIGILVCEPMIRRIQPDWFCQTFWRLGSITWKDMRMQKRIRIP